MMCDLFICLVLLLSLGCDRIEVPPVINRT